MGDGGEIHIRKIRDRNKQGQNLSILEAVQKLRVSSTFWTSGSLVFICVSGVIINGSMVQWKNTEFSLVDR